MAPFVFHVDLDQFLAAVEMLRRPELRGRPVIVGGDGDPTKRGVVSTCSYEARAFGVRSGMPLRTALKRCPDAVFLPVDAPTYLEASRRVMDALRSFGFVVQEMGWDEAFIAVETDRPEDLAREIQQRVLERTELWCSIGIGDNKLQAKIATEEGKPAGVYVLSSDRWPALMGPRPTDALWGIGTKTARKLAAIGIGTVEELASADLDDLAAALGPSTGPWLARLARGEDTSPVSDAPWIPKGVSREHTFQQDLTDRDEVARELERIARDTAGDVAKDGRDAARVVVKVRFAPFTTKTRGVALERPTKDPGAI
ncbi:MAG TPA: DNA polymerase IV, partial [Actinomycetota bacterium]|nr:DNA polymerase IV [Actinomycetota bacterium]